MKIDISREDIDRAKKNMAQLIDSMSHFVNNGERHIFQLGFDSDIKEYIVLTDYSINIEKPEKATLWTARLIANPIIDIENCRLYNEEITLEWVMTDEQKEENMLFGFEGVKLYHIKARKSISEGIKRLMVCEVVERDCSESRAKAIIDEYNQRACP